MSLLLPTDLSPTSGPLLVGYILNWGLFGVLSMQVYLYYLAFPNDRAGHKWVVYGTYLLESAQTFMFTSSAFKTFATGFANPAVLDKVDLLWFSMFMMSGMVAFITQSFYAYRVSILAQSAYIAVVIISLAFLQLGGALAVGIQTKQAGLFSHFWSKNTFISTGIWEGSSTACDIIIAVAMIYYIIRRDSRPDSKESSIFIMRAINLTVETGALTAALALTTLALTFLPARPTYYQASLSVLAKMYSNSMLVAFNSRMRIAPVSASGTAHDAQIPLSYASGASARGAPSGVHARIGLGAGREEEVALPPNVYKIADAKREGSGSYEGETMFAETVKATQ